MISSGSTTLRLDLLIFSIRPTVTGLPSRPHGARTGADFLDLFGESQLAVRALVGLVADHALGEEAGEGLGDSPGSRRPSLRG